MCIPGKHKKREIPTLQLGTEIEKHHVRHVGTDVLMYQPTIIHMLMLAVKVLSSTNKKDYGK
jgi:hypothetical protein